MSLFERSGERQFAEDFLKRAAACLSAGEKIPLGKIANQAGIPGSYLMVVLSELGSVEDLRCDDQGWSLTEKGWTRGRQLLRAHRIYESFLADQTGMNPAHWHIEADRHEHDLDMQEVNRMADALNRPRFDPHGDAIPTRQLEMQERKGCLLSQVQQDGIYRIVHIEDEPQDIYEKSSGVGIAPGLIVDVEVLSGGRYRLRWAGLDAVLDSSQAAGLNVRESNSRERNEVPCGNLYQLLMGTKARIHSISPAVRGLQRRRLLDLGFVPGSQVYKEGVAAFDGPMCFRIRGTLQALRAELARHVFTLEGTEMDHGRNNY